MGTVVDLDELLAACDWVSAGGALGVEAEAYIDRRDGKIHWCGDAGDDELPDDVGDEDAYVPVPHPRELGLGRALAFRFVEARLPRLRDEVEDCFRRKGAYPRFKSLLDRAGQLPAWHAYEEQAKEAALVAWCEENGLSLSRRAAGEPPLHRTP